MQPDEARSAATALDEIPKPPVKRKCERCAQTYAAIRPGFDKGGIVSPAGVDHIGMSGGVTACRPRRDATGSGWWWPL